MLLRIANRGNKGNWKLLNEKLHLATFNTYFTFCSCAHMRARSGTYKASLNKSDNDINKWMMDHLGSS